MDTEIVQWLRTLIQHNNVKAFYNCELWKHKRREALKRDNNECQKCKAKGLYSAADCVHHKQHVKKHPELALDLENLISLCNSCHDEEHPEKLHKSKHKFINEERW